MTDQPAWFRRLQRDLPAPVAVPDGAAIDWVQCSDLFLIPLLQRLESRWSSPHPAIVRRLLERRLAGGDVTAELSAAAADAAKAAAAAAAWAAAAARAAATAAAWTATAAAAERADQLADLQAALAASTQRSTLPNGYTNEQR